LGERFEVGQAQLLAQAGLAGQEYGEVPSAVPVEVGEQRQQGQHVGLELTRFGGHLILMEKGVPDAQTPSTVPS
jgi:hypothetical protein